MRAEFGGTRGKTWDKCRDGRLASDLKPVLWPYERLQKGKALNQTVRVPDESYQSTTMTP